MVATCIGINLPFSFAGIEVMNCFEPNRRMALQLHMQKFGAKLTIEKRGEFETMHFDGKTTLTKEKSLEFNHLDDHRVVMALAALTPMGCNLSIENPRLVSKSYPSFWDDLRRVGFKVE